ncbi:MAG: hypothetical protein EOO40_01575 [Deltaproteobacteria bacterium]|nr:MAG: hypothetical protein EOO40_01575 [Deltaproteobacteria bacterium]
MKQAMQFSRDVYSAAFWREHAPAVDRETNRLMAKARKAASPEPARRAEKLAPLVAAELAHAAHKADDVAGLQTVINNWRALNVTHFVKANLSHPLRHQASRPNPRCLQALAREIPDLKHQDAEQAALNAMALEGGADPKHFVTAAQHILQNEMQRLSVKVDEINAIREALLLQLGALGSVDAGVYKSLFNMDVRDALGQIEASLTQLQLIVGGDRKKAIARLQEVQGLTVPVNEAYKSRQGGYTLRDIFAQPERLLQLPDERAYLEVRDFYESYAALLSDMDEKILLGQDKALRRALDAVRRALTERASRPEPSGDGL